MAGNWLFFPLFGNAANWQSQQTPSHWVLPGTSQAPKGPASTLLAEDPRHPLEVADCIACACPCPPSWVRGSGRSAWMGFGSINRDSACEPGQVGQHVEKQAVGLCLRVKARLPWGGTLAQGLWTWAGYRTILCLNRLNLKSKLLGRLQTA